jgi:hypothetical protein
LAIPKRDDGQYDTDFSPISNRTGALLRLELLDRQLWINKNSGGELAESKGT